MYTHIYKNKFAPVKYGLFHPTFQMLVYLLGIPTFMFTFQELADKGKSFKNTR